jgi:hypothetical protein
MFVFTIVFHYSKYIVEIRILDRISSEKFGFYIASVKSIYNPKCISTKESQFKRKGSRADLIKPVFLRHRFLVL